MKKLPRNIQRHDRRGFHGWSVRLTRRGEEHTRFFADRPSGSREAALRAALLWRDGQLLALHPPVRVRRFRTGNTSGVVGVFLDRRRVAGRSESRYVAQWPEGSAPRRVVRRYFAVRKYGKRRAFELAVEARRAGVEELEGKVRGQLALEVVSRRRSSRA